ncbi:MAG TPA: hypothetical protein RMH99_17465 [Sandaracinaceae bacterium LLY-WYZ-13_1]|nr:hypothetical protein [Sandaracinaceae bacterium LLY-WYZ-13_1]
MFRRRVTDVSRVDGPTRVRLACRVASARVFRRGRDDARVTIELRCR